MVKQTTTYKTGYPLNSEQLFLCVTWCGILVFFKFFNLKVQLPLTVTAVGHDGWMRTSSKENIAKIIFVLVLVLYHSPCKDLNVYLFENVLIEKVHQFAAK